MLKRVFKTRSSMADIVAIIIGFVKFYELYCAIYPNSKPKKTPHIHKRNTYCCAEEMKTQWHSCNRTVELIFVSGSLRGNTRI